jgi:cytochrome P450
MRHLSNIGLVAFAALALCGLGRMIYNLYFHPLAKYPGPFLHRATRLAFIARQLRGTLARDMLAFHELYGPVVRVAPDELAFSSAQAWKDIYGHRTGTRLGAEEMPKSEVFYSNHNMPRSIISENRDNHAVLRRLMAHGFSDRSMREQESIIGAYVDLLISRLREHAVDWDVKDERTGLQKKRKLNLVSWYNWTTFDVIGDLAFGEPFGCLDRAQYDPWVAAIWDTIRSNAFFLSVKYMGLQALTPLLDMKLKGRKEHNSRTAEKVRRRAEMSVERPDLIEGLLSKKEELGFRRLTTNASVLILAGSETTATLLSGATYLLLSNPETLRRLTEEVRSSFKSDDEITLLSVGNLTYMLACLNEAMRCYPPVPVGLPRTVPRGGGTIAGNEVPERVSLSPCPRRWTRPGGIVHNH